MTYLIHERHRPHVWVLAPLVCVIGLFTGCGQEFRPSFALVSHLSASWEAYRAAELGDCKSWLRTTSLSADGGVHGYKWLRFECDGGGPVVSYLGPGGEPGGVGAETDVVSHLLPGGRVRVDAPFAQGGAEVVDLTAKNGSDRFDQLVQSHCDLLIDGQPWRYVAY